MPKNNLSTESDQLPETKEQYMARKEAELAEQLGRDDLMAQIDRRMVSNDIDRMMAEKAARIDAANMAKEKPTEKPVEQAMPQIWRQQISLILKNRLKTQPVWKEQHVQNGPLYKRRLVKKLNQTSCIIKMAGNLIILHII